MQGTARPKPARRQAASRNLIKFKTHVVVEPGVIGRFRVVTGPGDAVLVLTGRWPCKEGRKYEAALKACREAARGRKPPHLARSSFVAAAREARVLITSEELTRYTLGDGLGEPKRDAALSR